jgi:hypothetical protein
MSDFTIGYRAWALRSGRFIGIRDIKTESFATPEDARGWTEHMRSRCPWYQDFVCCATPVYPSVSTMRKEH